MFLNRAGIGKSRRITHTLLIQIFIIDAPNALASILLTISSLQQLINLAQQPIPLEQLIRLHIILSNSTGKTRSTAIIDRKKIRRPFCNMRLLFQIAEKGRIVIEGFLASVEGGD